MVQIFSHEVSHRYWSLSKLDERPDNIRISADINE